jgi:hypothetical protein
MRTREWNLTYSRHKIRVMTAPNEGAKLFVDDELLDSTNDLYACGEEPTLVGMVGEDDELFQIDVHIKPLETPLAEIRVNGERIGGDLSLAIAPDSRDWEGDSSRRASLASHIPPV